MQFQENKGRRSQGSPPIHITTPASTMKSVSRARAFIGDAGVENADTHKGRPYWGLLWWHEWGDLRCCIGSHREYLHTGHLCTILALDILRFCSEITHVVWIEFCVALESDY